MIDAFFTRSNEAALVDLIPVKVERVAIILCQCAGSEFLKCHTEGDLP